MATGQGVRGQGTLRNVLARPPVARFLTEDASPWAVKDTPTTTWAGSPSPQGQCARFLKDDASPWAMWDTPTTTWAGLPVPPQAGVPRS